MNTRRQFLLDCSKVAAVAVTATPSVMVGATRSRDPMALANFRQALHTVFVAQTNESRKVKLELIHVEQASSHLLGEQPHEAPDRNNERFSLMFRGPLNGELEQDTYSFNHKTMGTFPMFIVPQQSKDKNSRYYEAVFNRLNEQNSVNPLT